MARKTKAPSRKRRGLKWLTVLAVLLLVNVFLNLYCLFPGQALAEEESRYGLWDAETVGGIWNSGQRLYLRRSDTYFSLSAVAFHPLTGWESWMSPLVIPLDDEQLWGAQVNCSGTEANMVLFGFVPDGEEAPTLSVRVGEADNRFGNMEYETEIDQIVPQADISGEGGNYYLSSFRYTIPQDGYAAVYIQEQEMWVRLEHLSVSW